LEIFTDLISIVIPIIYVDYTYRRTAILNYNSHLNALLDEIKTINNNMDFYNFYRNIHVCEWRLIHQKLGNWLPKSTSYGLSYGLYQSTFPRDWERSHGLPGYLLQYLPSKAYYNFMEQGFYANIKFKESKFTLGRISEGRLQHLMELYDYAIEFSQRSQEFEQMIHDLDKMDENNEDLIKLLFAYIIDHFERIKPTFDEHYSAFDVNNLHGLEITIRDSYMESLVKWAKTSFLENDFTT